MLINPRNRPSVRFLPIIASALDPNGGADAQAFREAFPAALRERVLFAWNRLPERERLRRFGRPAPAAGAFADRLQRASLAYQEARRELESNERALLHREALGALRVGIGAYRPSAEIAQSASLTRQLWELIGSKLAAHDDDDCCDEDAPAPQPRYGLRIRKVTCRDQTEGNGILPGNDDDEVYFVSVAVDGAGRLIARRSPKVRIDDDDNSSESLAGAWIYPVQDPGGFLDAAVSMYEDDGGYGAVGEHIANLGQALTQIPQPYVVTAGVAIQIIGEVIQIADLVDEDDYFGTRSLRWTTAASLAGGVGSTSKTYWGEDWSGDSYDFRVSFKLETAA
jgi:hypothetical protein